MCTVMIWCVRIPGAYVVEASVNLHRSGVGVGLDAALQVGEGFEHGVGGCFTGGVRVLDMGAGF